jgi:metal-responsive CopG/Arc/MetJ family transcriptional regulator
MSNTITVRLERELAAWLERASAESGLSRGEIVREQLRKAKTSGFGAKSFMSLAGVISGPKSLSRRKGFSRS